MYRSSQSTPRMAAVSSGTLFGITLAIVAGLVVAASVKLFILDQKPKPVPPPEMRELTVAAVNILDKMQISAGQVKTIQVPVAKFQEWEKRAKENDTVMLIGKQPVNRTTILPIPAEEPIFANQLEKMSYPEPVSNRLHDGMRAVIVEVPTHDAMVQAGDQVDVLCTMSADNATFGKGSTNTGALARHASVVARFGTTRTGAQAAPGDKTRSYTLEVTPYRFALIELAKSLGGKFSLSVNNKRADDGTATPASTWNDKDPDIETVTVKDLARAMGFVPPPPHKVWSIETYNGVKRGPDIQYDGYDKSSAPKDKSDPTKPDAQIKEAGSTNEGSTNIQRHIVRPDAYARQSTRPRSMTGSILTAPITGKRSDRAGESPPGNR